MKWLVTSQWGRPDWQKAIGIYNRLWEHGDRTIGVDYEALRSAAQCQYKTENGWLDFVIDAQDLLIATICWLPDAPIVIAKRRSMMRRAKSAQFRAALAQWLSHAERAL